MTEWVVTGTSPLRVSKQMSYMPGAKFSADAADPQVAFWVSIGAITAVGKTPLGTVDASAATPEPEPGEED